MGKKKKTLKEKKLAELRRFTEPHGKYTSSPEESVDAKTQSDPTKIAYTFSSPVHAPIIQSYSLQHDLRKTLIVSLGILLFLLTLSTLLHNHAFVLPLIPLRY